MVSMTLTFGQETLIVGHTLGGYDLIIYVMVIQSAVEICYLARTRCPLNS